MNNAAVESAIAFALSTYLTPVSQETPKVIAKIKPAKAKVEKAPANNAVKPSVETTEGPKVSPLPEKGTLDAKGFLLASRRAKSRDESIAAIAAYIGYNQNESFGTNDSAARMQAKREMNPIAPAKEEYRRNGQSPSNSVVGYIAGVPNHRQRQLQDLLARERMAVEEMGSFEQKAKEATSEAERNVWQGRAMLEKVRLQAIQKDIERF